MKEYYNVQISDYEVSEKQKSESPYLIAYMDDMISSLVVEHKGKKREKMLKMRNLYDGIRDKEEFKYLEDNFGIGNPADIKFIPIIRNRIDVLIGLMSAAAFDFQCSVMDQDTLFLMMQEKNFAVLQEVYDQIQEHAERVRQQSHITDEQTGNQPYVPKNIKKFVQTAKKKIDREWRSSFVKAANKLIKYFLHDIDIDMHQKRRLLFEDLLVVGEMAYRVLPKKFGRVPQIEVLLPENCYYELPRDKKYMKQAMRFVYVKYMSKVEILTDLGHIMDKEDRETLFTLPSMSYTRTMRTLRELEMEGNKDKEIERYVQERDVHKVYFCEWIANNEKILDVNIEKSRMPVEGPDKVNKFGYRQDRYQGIRIEDDIYLEMGKSEFVRRTSKDPDKAELSFNGIRFSDRGGEPYSLTWKCKDIQDMHDIMYFHRDVLVANSGVDGSRINMQALPDFLGTTMEEKLIKFLAYRKQGIELVDLSKEEARAFQHYGDFKAALSGDAVTAINSIIAQLDNEASQITGVTQAMLGVIEQREAVSNVKQGLQQTSLVTKNLFDHNDTVTKHLLTDMLTMTQLSYQDSDGFTGSFIQRTGQEVFHLIPSNFCFSDYNMHITSTSEEYTKVQLIRGLASDLINAQAIRPYILIKLIATDSLHEMMELLEDEFEVTETSNRQVAELQQQVDTLTKTNKELDSKVKKAESDQRWIDQARLKLESWKAGQDVDLKQQDIDNTDKYNEKQIDLKEETVKLEKAQLELSVGREKEVKNL